MKLLFPDREDPEKMLRAVEAYWREMFYTCAKQLGVSDQWGPWFEPFSHFTEGDQTAQLFSAINTRESRGIQIGCWMEETDEETIFGHTTTFGKSFGNPVYMLQVECVPTEQTAPIMESLIKIWLAPDTVLKNFDLDIDTRHIVSPAS